MQNTPKIVAGLTSKASTRAVDFYSKFIENVIVVESLEVAETAKLLENSFRLVNISFVNEISIFCQKLGIDVNAVINAALVPALFVSPATIFGVFFSVHFLFVGSIRSGEKTTSNSSLFSPEPFSNNGTRNFLVVSGSTVDSKITNCPLVRYLAIEFAALSTADKSGL